MEPFHVLNRGQKYTKQDLANLLNEPGLTSVGEGVESWANSNSYLLFCTIKGILSVISIDNSYLNMLAIWPEKFLVQMVGYRLRNKTQNLLLNVWATLRGITTKTHQISGRLSAYQLSLQYSR